MNKILISACLLGEKVRFDGKMKKLNAKIIQQWLHEKCLVPLCPEVAGGLAVPRLAAEIQANHIINSMGEDVTAAFALGAQKALDLCQQHHIKIAVLKEGSPSCGVHKIYDGSFKHRKITGRGLTARVLIEAGIDVFNEHELDSALALYSSL